MRKPKPQPHLHFRPDGQQYAEVVQHQCLLIHTAADSIEAGEPFDEVRQEVVAVLRARAKQKWKGRPPKGAPPSREPERTAIRAAADRIEAGASFDAVVVTKALRAWANSLKSTLPPELGAPSKVDHASIALEWMARKRRKKDISDFELREELALEFDVDVSTIDYAVAKYGSPAERLLWKLFEVFGARWEK